MGLPVTIRELLDNSGISWQLLDADTAPEALRGGAVRTVVLQDGFGRLQALIGADCLLDIAALNRFTGRDFNALPDDELASLCAASDLRTLPSLPAAFEMPVVVERRLLGKDDLLLETGRDAVLLRVSGPQFRRLIESTGAASADFGVAISEFASYSPDPADDEADFSSAVAKFTTRRIQKRLEDTLDFPPMPETARRVIQIGADPASGVTELAQVVEVDPALAAQLISWASSPYYAAPGKISSVRDAIHRVLGFDLVMNLALGLSLGTTLRLPRDGRYGYRNYWLQAVHCAAMMENLCKALPQDRRPIAGHAYLAGLLHNFGFLLLAELFKPQLQTVCRYTESNPHLGHWQVERFLLGATREQMGAWLLRNWKVPEEICAAVRHQHRPDLAGEQEPLAMLLHVSSRILRHHGIGSAPCEHIPDAAFAQLGISREVALAASERVMRHSETLGDLARDLAA
jgi:HD-like signal output (HDOD) protein/prolyl-tRNA editing enzyme YbaK/EbsC (Cys-tRNA(Pro) deacylase)